MKTVIFDGTRWWLKYQTHLGHDKVPFSVDDFNKVKELIIEDGKTIIEPHKEYFIYDDRKIKESNHDPKCTAGYPDKSHYECAGTGIMAMVATKIGEFYV